MTLTAVLLAGGESRRMGTDKASLKYGGEPLWERQLRLLRGLELQALWVSARTRPAWCPHATEVVLDESPSRGPLSGIAGAFARIATSHLLALAVDMPRMSLEHLNKLRSLISPGSGVIPVNDGWFEPLCAIYPVQAAAEAARILTQSDTSMQRFVGLLCRQQLLRQYELYEGERALYQNVNTAADLTNLLSPS